MTPAPGPELDDDLLALAQERLAGRPFWCALPDTLLDRYRQSEHTAFLGVIRVGWWTLALMVVLITAAVYGSFQDKLVGWDWQVWSRLALVTDSAFFILLAGALRPAMFRYYTPWFSGWLCLILAAQLITALLLRDPRLAQNITYVVMQIDFLIMLCVGLSPLRGVLTCLGGLALALPAALALGAKPDWPLLLGYHLGAVACLWLEAMLIERAKRFRFLQELLLDHQNRRLAQQRAQLERMAHYDALTGLANRRHFDEQLAREWSRCKREGSPLAVLMLDVDHFKRYNDHYGHANGDDCLAAVGHAIGQALLRPADLAARYGGEEFVVLLPNAVEADAQALAGRILAAVDALALAHADSPTGAFVTVSIGHAALVPGPDTSPQALLKAADDALYTSKHTGRHRITGARPLTAADLAVIQAPGTSTG